MTYPIALLISCVLFPIFGWVGMSFTKRTIYRPITSDEGVARDEQAERDKVKAIREQGVRKTFISYAVIVAALFLIAALTEPYKKVYAALNPPTATNTPTATSTRPPTFTPTPTSATTTPTGEGGANFLTSIADAGTYTPFPTRTPFLPPSGGGSGGGTITIIQTRIVPVVTVVQVTKIVPHYIPVTVVNTVQVPVTVVVTATPLPPLPPASPTPTFTASPTFTATLETPSPTPTFTETPNP